jgi:3D (Asp-Asp-Asp) domain-containing protein
MTGMMISGSHWRKAVATLAAAAAFLSLYEARMLDSQSSVRPPAEGGPPPGPGAPLPFVATAYCKGEITRSGVSVRAGMAAADPALLPLGSVIELDAPDSRYDGIYTILDTGPAVRGRKVDIYMWSCHEALRFGRQSVRLTVLRLGWDPRATAAGFMDRLLQRTGAAGDLAHPPSPIGN